MAIIFNQQQRRPPSGMLQSDFYTQQQDQPTTQDYILAHLQRIKQRSAPPALQPGSRAVNISRDAVGPDQFKSFYQRLATIKQIGQEQLARTQAETALAQIRAASRLNSTPRPAASAGSSIGRAVGSVPSNPRTNFQFAQNIAGNYGWGSPAELGAWYTLGMKESGWRNNAQNPTSTAYGIGQFLDSTWRGYGIPKTSDPAQQVEAMARYIKARYGSPSRALAFHNSHNWY